MKPEDRIYLDYAAATPLDERIAAAMTEAQTHFANPSSAYAEGRSAREAFEAAKKRAGMVLGVRADEIVFTSGATESDNLAILGAVRPHIAAGAHVVTLPTEHQSVLEPVEQLRREGAKVDFARVDSGGAVDLGDLENQIGDSTILVSIAYASSEIGTIQPLTKVGALIAKINKSRAERGSTTPLLLHSDCSAAAGLLPLSPIRLGVDLLTLNGSKLYGPRAGLLVARRGVAPLLQPLLFGGGQQQGMRPGTEDVASALGLATALELAEQMRVGEVARLKALRDRLLEGIQALSPTYLLNGSASNRLANNVNITLPGYSGEGLVAHFDALGMAVATGAACAASREEPSHVLLAIGRTPAQAQSSLRITLGRQTTVEQTDHFLTIFKQVLSRLATM